MIYELRANFKAFKTNQNATEEMITIGLLYANNNPPMPSSPTPFPIYATIPWSKDIVI